MVALGGEGTAVLCCCSEVGCVEGEGKGKGKGKDEDLDEDSDESAQ